MAISVVNDLIELTYTHTQIAHLHSTGFPRIEHELFVVIKGNHQNVSRSNQLASALALRLFSSTSLASAAASCANRNSQKSTQHLTRYKLSECTVKLICNLLHSLKRRLVEWLQCDIHRVLFAVITIKSLQPESRFIYRRAVPEGDEPRVSACLQEELHNGQIALQIFVVDERVRA